MKNILVCTDFSSNAYCALHYAASLFKSEPCNIFILHSYHDEITISQYMLVNDMQRRDNQKLISNSEEKLIEISHSIKRDVPSEKHQYYLINTERSLTKSVSEEIKKQRINLLVMGTRGKAGIYQSFFGSNSIKIIEKIYDIPILIIPREYDFKAPQRIGLATDFLTIPKLSEFNILKELLNETKADLRILYSGYRKDHSKIQWSAIQEFKEIFEKKDLEIDYIPTYTEVSQAISDHVKTNKIDLLCMVHYEHKGFELFRENVIEEIDLHLRFPFLILPSKEMR